MNSIEQINALLLSAGRFRLARAIANICALKPNHVKKFYRISIIYENKPKKEYSVLGNELCTYRGLGWISLCELRVVEFGFVNQ